MRQEQETNVQMTMSVMVLEPAQQRVSVKELPGLKRMLAINTMRPKPKTDAHRMLMTQTTVIGTTIVMGTDHAHHLGGAHETQDDH